MSAFLEQFFWKIHKFPLSHIEISTRANRKYHICSNQPCEPPWWPLTKGHLALHENIRPAFLKLVYYMMPSKPVKKLTKTASFGWENMKYEVNSDQKTSIKINQNLLFKTRTLVLVPQSTTYEALCSSRQWHKEWQRKQWFYLSSWVFSVGNLSTKNTKVKSQPYLRSQKRSELDENKRKTCFNV